jgi:DNA-binding XRE family transcriptional regulator
MKLEGKIWQDGRWWLVEVPDLDVMTQGKSRRHALAMICDAVQLLADEKGFKVRVDAGHKGYFTIETDQVGPLLSLLLKRQRIKNKMTVNDVVAHLGLKSKNAYAQYEQGRNEPSLSQFQKFIQAIRPQTQILFKVV